MKQKIQTLLGQLNHGLVEREEVLKTALLTVLAGENLVLIGPPGTGKSMIARRIADSLAAGGGARQEQDYFEYLLTKFSTPEEIFGPLSIAELKQDRFRRNTAGYLPTVRMAFLDEIFKASSSILNALLTILNERVYHNGTEAQKVPLQALVAASNELPADQEELGALYDRFMVRRFVDYVGQDKLALLFERPGPMPALSRLDADDLAQIRQRAERVAIPAQVAQAVQRIWIGHKQLFKEDARESLSDRRLKKAIGLLCVAAATNGRSEVDLSDVFLLKDCLWNHPDNALKVRELILNTLRGFSHPVARDAQETQETPADVRARPQDAPRATGAVLRGYAGSGTRDDPFLVGDLHELVGLERPEVSQKGYHFRQTADIDCRQLGTWINVSFHGHYDGGGHAITYQKTGSDWHGLFAALRPGSSVANLRLDALVLANMAEESHIAHCATTANLVRYKASQCTIVSCAATGYLVDGIAIGCTIGNCRAQLFLVRNAAQACTISDCQVAIELVWSTADNYSYLGGIAGTVGDGSVVERCFVSGRLQNYLLGNIFIGGISRTCERSTIRHCAVGRIELQGSFVKLIDRIADAKMGATLENNIAIDSNPESNTAHGSAGKTVPAFLFTQRYFEDTLGWDFATVWAWDDAAGQPELRMQQRAAPQAAQGASADLLTEQMRANLWV